MKLWCKSLCTLVVLGLCAAAHHSIAAAVKPAAHIGPTYTDANLEQAAVRFHLTGRLRTTNPKGAPKRDCYETLCADPAHC